MLDEANLLLMAIDPQMQGKGLGYQLLETSIERLENQPVQIFLEVRESNKAAIGLYEKTGFHQIDVRRNYYPTQEGGRENAVIMVKAVPTILRLYSNDCLVVLTTRQNHIT